MGIELKPETVTGLATLAAAEGLSVEAFLQALVEKKLSVRHSDTSSIVEEMRALRARVKPDPDGWTIRDYIDYGRR